MIYLVGNLSLSALVWILLALVGVGLSYHSIREFNRELQAREQLGVNGTLALSARVLKRNSSVKLRAYLVFLVLGLLTVLLGHPNPHPTLASVLFGWGLVAVQIDMIQLQLRNLIDRRHIYAELRAAREEAT
jgi:hypothetical protein